MLWESDHRLVEISLDPFRLFDREALASVVLLAHQELREPLVSLESLVLLAPLDPRWVLQQFFFRSKISVSMKRGRSSLQS